MARRLLLLSTFCWAIQEPPPAAARFQPAGGLCAPRVTSLWRRVAELTASVDSLQEVVIYDKQHADMADTVRSHLNDVYQSTASLLLGAPRGQEGTPRCQEDAPRCQKDATRDQEDAEGLQLLRLFSKPPFFLPGHTRFIVMATVENLEQLFQFIVDHSLESSRWQWVVLSSRDTRAIVRPLLREGTRVVLLKLPDVVGGANSAHSCRDTIFKASGSGGYNSSTSAEVSSPSDLNSIQVPVFRSSVHVSGDVQFNSIVVMIFEFRAEGWGVNFTQTEDKQNRENSSVPDNFTLFPDLLQEYQDLGGRTLVVTTFFNNPWILFNPSSNLEDPDLERGIDGNLLRLISNHLNFSYTVQSPPDGEWGRALPNGNGTWTGLVGQVQQRQAHFTINELTITDQRLQVVDMTNFYFIDTMAAVTHAPRVIISFSSVMRPFSAEVWVALLALLLVTGPLLRLLAPSTPQSWGNTCLDALRPLLHQSGPLPYHGTPSRLLLAIWFLYSLLVCAHYSGVLYLHLTVQSYEATINSAEELLHRVAEGGFTVGGIEGSFTSELVLGPGLGTFGKISKYRKPDWNRYNNLMEYLFLIAEDPNWAMFWGKTGLTITTLELGQWKYHVSSKEYFPNALGLACQKGSPLTLAINKVLAYVKSSGLVNLWLKDRLLAAAKQKQPPTETRLVVLTLPHLALGFAILGVGALAAGFVFVAERVFFATRTRKRRRIFR